ncbi:hypothetical protein P3X46_017989 [Hevea brasiliensis]|uniref:DUF538 family protein n=1 Tax=Hevea brasiliensis TaxID=3981 RepID=A0ABQ9LSJ2_HEVBR|nr:uncharacterized protein LOC110652330 [Hevea brasiliensis]KAJ9169840.1 hypothetical protein P3X46_017989 [Hevea brasiliensis]
MVRFLPLLSLIILYLAISIPGVNPWEEDSSVYDVLKDHGLPMGLFPKGVKDFTINGTGHFLVHLDQACNAKFESELHYDRNVSGTLSYGQIGALSGISAQELFLWFPVKGIRVDVPSSGVIYFDVGVVSKQFSLSLFETPRDCLAVRDGQAEAIESGRLIAEAVSKSQLGELRYQLDQENFGRVVL